MRVAFDRRERDMRNCHRRERLRDLATMAEMQSKIDLLEECLQKVQKRKNELERENFQLKMRRK